MVKFVVEKSFVWIQKECSKDVNQRRRSSSEGWAGSPAGGVTTLYVDRTRLGSSAEFPQKSQDWTERATRAPGPTGRDQRKDL